MKACDYCGTQNPDEAINCPGCGTTFEIPAPPIPPSTPGSVAGAGYGIRLLARLIDTFFGLVVGFFAGLVAGSF